MPLRCISSGMAVSEISFIDSKTLQSTVCPGAPVRPRKSRPHGWFVIAYIHSYTPNINHSQGAPVLPLSTLSLSKNYRKKSNCGGSEAGSGSQRAGPGEDRRSGRKVGDCRSPCVAGVTRTFHFTLQNERVQERDCVCLKKSVTCNFNAKHGSAATCLRRQGLSQVALTGTVCEPACGSS